MMPSFGEIILLIIIALVLWKGLSWFFKMRKFIKMHQHNFNFQQQQYQQQQHVGVIDLVACPSCGVMQPQDQSGQKAQACVNGQCTKNK